jgi:hypothetical protein
VKCSGQEGSLLECKFDAWGEHDCSAKEYAGVICKVEQVDFNYKICGHQVPLFRSCSKEQFLGKKCVDKFI